MSPSDSSLAITGSRLEIASISPFWMAATAPAPRADADERGVVGLQARLGHQRIARSVLVEEPGAVTPIFRPLRSAGDLILSGLVLLDRERDAGKRPSSMTARDVLALGLHADRVLVGAGDDVDRAADQRLQRLARRRRNR